MEDSSFARWVFFSARSKITSEFVQPTFYLPELFLNTLCHRKLLLASLCVSSRPPKFGEAAHKQVNIDLTWT